VGRGLVGKDLCFGVDGSIDNDGDEALCGFFGFGGGEEEEEEG